MRKTKMEKGITLIALIITIVVLLILAVVAINSITNDGLLGKTENAATKYNQAVSNEQNILNYYEEYLTLGQWQQDKTTVTMKNKDGTTVTLTVGQTVEGYDAGVSSYTGGWAVLGTENGKLLLVSKVNVSTLNLKGKDGYNNGISSLNTVCSSYLNSTLADEARSIKADDINRVTGYNPENTGDGTRYGVGYPYQYGNTVTYTLNSEGYVVYTSKVATGSNANGISTSQSFTHVDGTVLTTSNSIDVISNSYNYYPNTLTTSSTGITKGIETTSDAYKVLFEASKSSSGYYWIAFQCRRDYPNAVGFGLSYIGDGSVNRKSLWSTSDGAIGYAYGVRAVVSLKSEVNISSSGVIS